MAENAKPGPPILTWGRGPSPLLLPGCRGLFRRLDCGPEFQHREHAQELVGDEAFGCALQRRLALLAQAYAGGELFPGEAELRTQWIGLPNPGISTTLASLPSDKRYIRQISHLSHKVRRGLSFPKTKIRSLIRRIRVETKSNQGLQWHPRPGMKSA